jgi:hypothetical protein
MDAMRTGWGLVVAAACACGACMTACGNHRPYDETDAAIPVDACTDGIGCQVDNHCPGGGHTTLTGTVWAPNGTLPLYNASVFVPTQPLEAFTPGVSCDRCANALSGSPLVQAQTGADGSFTLADVPSGPDIPLVIQLGRWRREVRVPNVMPCADNLVTDPDLTRLPRNREEGDIPHMAIATGAADPLECLLLKLGLDPAEITAPLDGGRISFFTATDAPGTDLDPPAPTAADLYGSLDTLTQYDAVLLPCEGGPFDKSVVDGTPLPTDPRVSLSQYIDLGGRVFTTHYSYDWWTYPGSIYNQLAAPQSGSGEWPVEQADEFNDTITAPIELNFPKGVAFAEWLGYAGVTSPPDQLDIEQGRHDITGVNPQYVRPWVTYDFDAVASGPGVMHFTFDTPLDPPLDGSGQPEYCGRVVFSDFHVTASAISNANLPFPAACNTDPLTDQEKALAFMLFDLTSCVDSTLE